MESKAQLKRPALGRGLGALIPGGSPSERRGVMNLGIEEIRPNRHQRGGLEDEPPPVLLTRQTWRCDRYTPRTALLLLLPSPPILLTRVLKVIGLPEAKISARVHDLAGPGIELAYCVAFPEVQLKLRATGRDLAANLSLQETIKHLFHLEQGGIVLRTVDGLYSLDNDGLEKLARQQFEGTRPAYIPDSMMKQDARKVLASHLNADGSIKQIPVQAGERKVLLDYVLNAFEPGKTYKEREVNLLLARFHKDTASLRRYLIDADMLLRERDGSKYWRPQ